MRTTSVPCIGQDSGESGEVDESGDVTPPFPTSTPLAAKPTVAFLLDTASVPSDRFAASIDIVLAFAERLAEPFEVTVVVPDGETNLQLVVNRATLPLFELLKRSSTEGSFLSAFLTLRKILPPAPTAYIVVLFAFRPIAEPLSALLEAAASILDNAAGMFVLFPFPPFPSSFCCLAP
jgi:hypothetical protein